MQQKQVYTTTNSKPRIRVILSEKEQSSIIDLFNAGMMIKDLSVKFGVGDVYISNILSRYYAFHKKECTCNFCNKTDIPQYKMKSDKICFDCFFDEKKKIDENKDMKLLYVNICEEYVGNESTILNVSNKLNVSQGVVIIALKRYYGSSFKPSNLRYI